VGIQTGRVYRDMIASAPALTCSAPDRGSAIGTLSADRGVSSRMGNRRYPQLVAEPRNEFGRLAAARQAAEENRPPSRWHRFWVAALGFVCLLQWSALLLIARTEWESVYLGNAVVVGRVG
jgi:hypothetical protein